MWKRSVVLHNDESNNNIFVILWTQTNTNIYGIFWVPYVPTNIFYLMQQPLAHTIANNTHYFCLNKNSDRENINSAISII